MIDRFEIDPHTSIVIRGERGGPRSFVELQVDRELAWQALIPPYAGRKGIPGVAWSPVAVSVRVIRDGRAEIFALSMHDASKLGGIHLAPEKGPVLRVSLFSRSETDHVLCPIAVDHIAEDW